MFLITQAIHARRSKRPIIIKFKGSKKLLMTMHTQIMSFYLCVCKKVCVCELQQFILIRFIDVTEMSNEALDRAVLSDKWRRKYLFLLHRLRCWHRYLFFTFFVPVNDVSRLVLYSNFFRMYKMLYLLHDKNRYLQRCIAISNCFFLKCQKSLAGNEVCSCSETNERS